MPRYSLFAARDGDVVSDVIETADDEAAEAWAMEVVCDAFRLDKGSFKDFGEMVAETDGLQLEQLGTDPIGEAAIALLSASSRLFSRLARDPRLKDPSVWEWEQVRDFLVLASALQIELQGQGYQDDRIDWL